MHGIIVGAGIIGSAVAYELSKRGVGDLHVVDCDLEGEFSSTERNAGGVRNLWQQQVNADLARVSLDLFHALGTQIGFQKTGYLWLFSKEKAGRGEQLLQLALRKGLQYEKWSVAQIRERYPFIDKTDDLAFAVFGLRDGIINSNALKTYYRSESKKKGTQFHDRKWVKGIEEQGNRVRVRMATVANYEEQLTHPESSPAGKDETWEADFAVLCAGAWMHTLLPALKVESLVEPIRRQICMFSAEGFNMAPYGMVVDTSGIYFHPEGGNILAGLVIKDEKPGYQFQLDNDFFEERIWPQLYERSSQLERLKPMGGWGGLYSYTPDGSGILGTLPGYQRVYECHSFTGRGVMQSYGAAVALADWHLEKRFKAFDASPLSRKRFQTGGAALLKEELHI